MGPMVIPSYFTAIDKFSPAMGKMNTALNGFVGRSERALGRLNGAFSRIMSPLSGMNNMLRGMGLYIGAWGVYRVLKGAIDIVADFQQANVNLAAVMGTTADKNKELAFDARKIGLAYGVAATEVVSMQHALATLGFEKADILKMGGPLITGANALEGADTQRLAETVGAVIQTFDNLEAKDTQHVLDVMTFAANRTALTFEKLATTLPIVNGPANALGITFEQQVALLGILANAGVHVATSATSLKNIFIDSQKKGHTYSQMLANVAANADKLTYAYNKFGKRSVVSALVLANKLKETAVLQAELENVKPNLTSDIATQRLNTFRGAQKLLTAAYQEFILSIEDGTGKYAAGLTGLLKVASAVLLLSSNSDQAREAIKGMDAGIVATAQTWISWLKIIGWVTGAFIAARVVLIAWSAAVAVARFIQGMFAVAMGVSAAAGMTNVWALKGNAVALGTLRAITAMATITQWGLNLATLAYIAPILIMTGGIFALIGVFKLMDNWVEKNMMSFNGLTGAMDGANDSLKAFYTDDYMQALKDDEAKKKIFEARKSGTLMYDFGSNEPTNPYYGAVPVNPKKEQQESWREAMQLNQTMNIGIQAPKGYKTEVQSSGGVTPTIENTNYPE